MPVVVAARAAPPAVARLGLVRVAGAGRPPAATALSPADRDAGRGRFAVPRPLIACGAGTLAQGSSLSGLTAGSHGGEPDTLAARLDAGRVTGASIGPGTWPRWPALGRFAARRTSG